MLFYYDKLTLDEYQTLAFVTMNPDLTDREILSNTALGLTGEFSEFLKSDGETEANKEGGDVMWYVAAAFTILKAKLSSQFTIGNSGEIIFLPRISDDPQAAIGRFSESAKKYLYHGKVLYTEDMISDLVIVTRYVLTYAGHNCLSNNINKLQKRYGTTFTEAKSEARVDVVDPMQTLLEFASSSNLSYSVCALSTGLTLKYGRGRWDAQYIYGLLSLDEMEDHPLFLTDKFKKVKLTPFGKLEVKKIRNA